MAEYIEREAVYREILTERTMSGYEKAYCCELIKDIQATDVAPVVHGRWENVQETDMYVPEMKFTMTQTAETCSACKARVCFVGAKQYLFDSICPSCGAKMD